MKALKKARKLIEKNPESPAARTVSSLVLALETETSFDLGTLYRLPYDEFQLALELLNEWRLDRYYASKLRLLDLSVQVDGLHQTGAAREPAAA
jgi:hypothetical protein